MLDAAFEFTAVFTLAALLIFGYVRGFFTGTRFVRSALHTALIGGQAATYGLAK